MAQVDQCETRLTASRRRARSKYAVSLTGGVDTHASGLRLNDSIDAACGRETELGTPVASRRVYVDRSRTH